MANRWQQQGGHPNGPVPAVRGKGGTRTAPKRKRPQPTGLQKKTPTQAPAQGPVAPAQQRVIPVRVLQAFYEELPAPQVQQIAIAEEAYYWNEIFVGGDPLILASFPIPQQVVYVFTDVEFYALTPPEGIVGAPQPLNTYALAGMLTLRIEFSGRTPLLLQYRPFNPYNAGPLPASNVYANPLSGWGFLDETFGAQRTSGFALYGRSSEIAAFSILPPTLSQLPRFPISRLGIKLFGFAVPEAEFDKLWQKFQA